MRPRIVVLVIWLLLFGPAWVSGADFASHWDALASRSLFLEFVNTNQGRIVNLTNVDSADRVEIRGLEVSDAPLADWSSLGLRLPNVVCLKVTSSAADLPATFFSAITNYPRLVPPSPMPSDPNDFAPCQCSDQSPPLAVFGD